MASLALVQHKKKQNSTSTSAAFIPPLKQTLTLSQRKKAVRILSPTLPVGWVSYLPVRRYGNHYGIPNWCPKCGVRPGKEIPQSRRKTWMWLHDLVAH